MPIYEYKCVSCEKVSTKITTFNDKPQQIPCKHCDIGVADSVVSKPAIVYEMIDAETRAAYEAVEDM
jgi:putative FmdB family regulatory protein